MTESSKLKLVFKNAGGEDVNFTFSSADKNVESSDVRALMNGMITNGTIYTNVPVAISSATMITTTETEINVNA